METHFGKNSAAKNLQFRKGTTTLAFIYEPKTENDKGGIIIAVDSRASAGEYICTSCVHLSLIRSFVLLNSGTIVFFFPLFCRSHSELSTATSTIFYVERSREVDSARKWNKLLFDETSMAISMICVLVGWRYEALVNDIPRRPIMWLRTREAIGCSSFEVDPACSVAWNWSVDRPLFSF